MCDIVKEAYTAIVKACNMCDMDDQGVVADVLLTEKMAGGGLA